MKKVLYAMAMFSMVAMFAACGGSDKKDGKEADKEGNSPKAMAEKIAKKICDCKGDDQCIEALMPEYEKAIASFNNDEAKIKEFNEAGAKATQGCE